MEVERKERGNGKGEQGGNGGERGYKARRE